MLPRCCFFFCLEQHIATTSKEVAGFENSSVLQCCRCDLYAKERMHRNQKIKTESLICTHINAATHFPLEEEKNHKFSLTQIKSGFVFRTASVGLQSFGVRATKSLNKRPSYCIHFVFSHSVAVKLLNHHVLNCQTIRNLLSMADSRKNFIFSFMIFK